MPETDDIDLRNELVSLTRDLVLIPGIDGRPKDIRRAIDFIGNHVESVPEVEIRHYDKDGSPSLIALPRGIETPEVMMFGHVDVIAHPDSSAYRSEIVDGRIIGPGAGDMKGPVAIILTLFCELHAKFPGVSLGLAITSDEERGGAGGVGYLVDEVGVRCGLAIIPDGGSQNEITEEEKGILHVELQATGHSAHAARPWLGRNAVELLTATVANVQEHFESFHDESPDHWYPTCVMTVVGTPNTTINRIPEVAQALLDIRFPPPHTVDSMLALIRNCADEGVEIHPRVHAEPTHLQPDQVFLDITAEVTAQPVYRIRAAGGSDARFLAQRGIPVIMSRPLMGEIHSTEEWIDIDSMLTVYHIYSEYLQQRLAL
jgi:succinyl-diaminopimelate desuccinylase